MANRRPLCPSPWRRHNTTIPRLQNLFFSFFLHFSSRSLHLFPPSLSLSLLCVSLSPFFQSSSSPPPPPPFFILLPSSLWSFSLQCTQIKHLYGLLSVHKSTRFVAFLWKCSCLHSVGGGFSLHQDADLRLQTGAVSHVLLVTPTQSCQIQYNTTIQPQAKPAVPPWEQKMSDWLPFNKNVVIELKLIELNWIDLKALCCHCTFRNHEIQSATLLCTKILFSKIL